MHDPESAGGAVGPGATLGDLSGIRSGRDFAMVSGEPFDADKAYKDSKLCDLLLAREFAARLKAAGSPVTVNAFGPGAGLQLATSTSFPHMCARSKFPLLSQLVNYSSKVPLSGICTAAFRFRRRGSLLWHSCAISLAVACHRGAHPHALHAVIDRSRSGLAPVSCSWRLNSCASCSAVCFFAVWLSMAGTHLVRIRSHLEAELTKRRGFPCRPHHAERLLPLRARTFHRRL